MTIKEIVDSNSAIRDSYYDTHSDPQRDAKEYAMAIWDSYSKNGEMPPSWAFDIPEYRFLKDKFKDRIKENSLGFSMSLPCPTKWYVVVDQILTKLLSEYPDMLIVNISIKNGGVRFVLENIPDNIVEELQYVEFNLWDRRILK